MSREWKKCEKEFAYFFYPVSCYPPEKKVPGTFSQTLTKQLAYPCDLKSRGFPGISISKMKSRGIPGISIYCV
eukprot:scaffold1814_cov156-Skeletonema_dohrnii-CCMP3373.AAC.2